MSAIDPTTVDVDDIIARIQAVRRGELPDDSVSVEELRAAIQAQRQRFTASAAGTAVAPGEAKPKKARAGGIIVPNLDIGL